MVSAAMHNEPPWIGATRANRHVYEYRQDQDHYIDMMTSQALHVIGPSNMLDYVL